MDMKRPDSRKTAAEPLRARSLDSLAASLPRDVPSGTKAPIRTAPDLPGTPPRRQEKIRQLEMRPRDDAQPGAQPGARAKRGAGGPLTQKRIRNISEHYVASRECTRAMLRAVLERRLARRARDLDPEAAERERLQAETLFSAEIARLVAAGLIDDARYAEMKIRVGLGKGIGSRKIAMDLATKGVDPQTVEDAFREARREIVGALGRDVDDAEVARSAEWEAAETFARKKRIGRFRDKPLAQDFPERQKTWRREAGRMARAGFDPDLIRQILDQEPEPE